jgi:hypothetical protein
MSRVRKKMKKNNKLKIPSIDELKTEILETKTEIKSKHYDDKLYQQSLINVLNNIESELIELESEMNLIEK